MVSIYVLLCDDPSGVKKWYIGKTEHTKFRIDTHFDSKGSGFTKKYPPTDIYQIIPECDKYDEDKWVKRYMDKYGIDNVRGGSYSSLELTSDEKKHIQKELWGANDLCFLCGGDHFVKDCPNKNQVETDNDVIIDHNDLEDKEEERRKIIENYENELFELTEGCWVAGYADQTMFQMSQKPGENYIPLCDGITEKYNLSKKVYKKFNEYPFSKDTFNRIEESDSFILQKSKNEIIKDKLTNQPSSIFIKYFINEKQYLVYHYKYSRKYYPSYKFGIEQSMSNQGKYPNYDMMMVRDSEHISCGGQNYYKDLYLKKDKELKQKLFMLKNVVFDNKIYINAEYNLQRTTYQKKIESCVEMIFRNIDNQKKLCGTRHIQENLYLLDRSNQYGQKHLLFPRDYKDITILNQLFNHSPTIIAKNTGSRNGLLRSDIIRFGEENTLSKLNYVVFTEIYIYYVFSNLGNESYTITFDENSIIKEFFKCNLHLIINSIQNYGFHVDYNDLNLAKINPNYNQTSTFAIILED